MSNGRTSFVGVMEGKGAYNKHAAIPAAGGSLAIPFLVRAAQQITLDTGDRPIVIADYGSSQGKNSLAPMRAATDVLRKRSGPERAISVCHTDLPDNDFSTLFELLESDPNSYVLGDEKVYPYAIGRSFYKSVFPPGHVDLGWSSYAAVWLSQIPGAIPDHLFIPRCGGALRAEFERQAASDWERFLALRAAELRPSGRLVVALPSLEHDGSTAFAVVMDHANAVLSELVAAGTITTEERARMTLHACPRRERDLLAPFTPNGRFQGLVVEHCSTLVAPDTAWTEYERDKNAAVLASKRALFFRVIFVPSLSQSLAPNRTAKERQEFADRMEGGVRQRLEGVPERIDHLVGIIVLAKQETT